MFLLNSLLKDWIAVISILGIAACTPSELGSTLESFQPIRSLKNSQQQVILNAENQYKVARQEGELALICTQAELVASTYFYLRGSNSSDYQLWKSIEKKDCEAFQAQESREITAQAIRSLGGLKAVTDQPID